MPRNYIVAVVIVALAGIGLYFAVQDDADAVATVNGDDIAYDDVIELMVVDGDVNLDVFRRNLLGMIADRVMVAQAQSEFGLERTDDEIQAAYDEVVGQITEGGVPLAEILTSSNLTEAGLEAISAQTVLQEKVVEALIAATPAPSEDVLQQRYNASLASVSNVCTSHILVATEEEAQSAFDRATAGEDFAELAIELSTGPSGPGGGDLGCGAPGNFVAEFLNATMQAPVGVPFGPVQTQFGFHVLLVHERTVPSFDERRDALADELAAEQSQTLWSEWLVGALQSADVVVAPEYGTWTTAPVPQIVPPTTP